MIVKTFFTGVLAVVFATALALPTTARGDWKSQQRSFSVARPPIVTTSAQISPPPIEQVPQRYAGICIDLCRSYHRQCLQRAYSNNNRVSNPGAAAAWCKAEYDKCFQGCF